jgi:hypothetical protein
MGAHTEERANGVKMNEDCTYKEYLRGKLNREARVMLLPYCLLLVSIAESRTVVREHLKQRIKAVHFGNRRTGRRWTFPSACTWTANKVRMYEQGIEEYGK